MAEQAERTIIDPYISHLSQADVDQLRALQRKLTVSIRLDKGLEDQEPNIHLEGLTRDVFTADSAVRSAQSFMERRFSPECWRVPLNVFSADHQGHHPEGGEDGELEEQGLADKQSGRMESSQQREDGALRHSHQP